MVQKASLDELGDDELTSVFDSPRTMRLKLGKREWRPEHQHPDKRVLFYVMDGEIDVSLDGEVVTVGENEAVTFSGDRDISPKATEDSEALVVFTDA